MTKKTINILFATLTTVAMAGCSENRQPHAQHELQATRILEKSRTLQTKPAKIDEGTVRYLTSEQFKKRVMDYDKNPQQWVFEGSRPAIIDFYATWCGPCRMMASMVEQFAKKYKGLIDFYKVDVDKEQNLATVLGIESIPTFLFVPANGNPTLQVGAMEKADFEAIIKSDLLKQQAPQM